MKFGFTCLLLLGRSLVAEAQPAIHFGGGGTFLAASHDPGMTASVLAPSLLASISTKDAAFGIEAEFKLPRRHVADQASGNRLGPYVQRFFRREAVVSALGRVRLYRPHRVGAAVLFGGSWITTAASVDVVRATSTSHGSDFSRTKFAWTGGVDWLTQFGCFTAIVPQVRFHLPIGPDPDVRASIGGAITWSPTSKWGSSRGGT